jgi:hypothetical protein
MGYYLADSMMPRVHLPMGRSAKNLLKAANKKRGERRKKQKKRRKKGIRRLDV